MVVFALSIAVVLMMAWFLCGWFWNFCSLCYLQWSLMPGFQSSFFFINVWRICLGLSYGFALCLVSGDFPFSWWRRLFYLAYFLQFLYFLSWEIRCFHCECGVWVKICPCIYVVFLATDVAEKTEQNAWKLGFDFFNLFFFLDDE